MYSRSILNDIMRLEMAMGPSHECHGCGSVFLAHSDGCPNCGSYRISSLHQKTEASDEWDMETYPVIFHHIEHPHCVIQEVKEGDFRPWPK